MSYESSGSLTTDERQVGTSTSWDTQTDWEAFQSKNNILIENGSLKLADAATIIDSFEDGDMSEYSYAAGSSAISVVQNASEALDGDYYMFYDGSTNSQLGSTSGLNYYPAPGDIFAFNVYIEQTGSADDRFGWGSVDDTYSEQYNAEMSQDNGTFNLTRAGNGISNEQLASTSVNWGNYTSRWLEFEVQWATNGDMTVTLWETPDRNSQVAQISANDSTLGAGGIGYQFYSNGNSRFDYYRKTGEL